MHCWTCDRIIAPNDMASLLPGSRAVVHRECYTDETGHQPPLRLTLADILRLDGVSAA
jgi:hypothetical protein